MTLVIYPHRCTGIARWAKWSPLVVLMLGASLSLQGQQPPAPAGVASPWGARQILDDLLKDNEKLTPLLNQMRTLDWESKKGAPSAYTTQWHTAQQQLSDVTAASRLLAQKTESLPLALDEYFRLEALEVTTRSLLEGVTRYGERSTADQLSGLIARNFNARERFRDYIRDLATSQEQDFKVADAEAQRCRAMISRQPAAKGTKK